MKIVFRLILVTFLATLLSGVALVYIEIQNQRVTRTYNQIRPKVIRDGGKQCLSRLSEKGINFTSLGDMQDGNCLIKNAVRINSLPETTLSGALTLNCRTASNFINWIDEIEATNIVHMGTYNCRKMRGSPLMSEHSFGTAIDIATINGASIKKHWNNDDPNGKYLRKAYKSGCRHFSNVISPDDNALHYDHFHLDDGYRSTCLPTWINKIKKEVLKYAP